MEGLIQFILPLALMIGIFYLLIFLPESKRKKKYSSMLGSLKVNDQVVTRGGIVGKVISITKTDNEEFVTIQTGPERAKIKLTKSAIGSVTKEAKVEEEK
ncbi:MAG: preprotein translocase subunit YajC [Bacillota bacterium]|nr:preprotein translocase subunit YajC [Bacillota bacterium]